MNRMMKTFQTTIEPTTELAYCQNEATAVLSSELALASYHSSRYNKVKYKTDVTVDDSS